MFTGIVQGLGTVVQAGESLHIRPDSDLPYSPPVGGSVAIDGCCLTHVGGELLRFDLSDETLARTTLGLLEEGSRVNIELALRAGDPIGGHFVLGHVDGVGELVASFGEEYRFRAPSGSEKFLADKGSITLAGVSLTVIEPTGLEFSVALIPHTLASTTLGSLKEGAAVNVEYDVLARYLLGK